MKKKICKKGKCKQKGCVSYMCIELHQYSQKYGQHNKGIIVL